ncbi:ABC transporter permease subunit [Sphingobium sp. LMA1-1-1.1]|uniref:ABC transporter permease subunit n=1 Tax=unclassified Sphingobium TaxID=2611147 RepID=UPI00343BABC9
MKRGPRQSWRWWLPQLLLMVALVAFAAGLGLMLAANMAERGMTADFAFLGNTARFPIAESLLPYSPLDSFAWAFVVGLGNTLFLTLLVILLSTLVGVPVALGRRSHHMLAHNLAGAFINLLRNTPLVVQLLFWYGVLTIGLPPSQEALQPLPGVFLTDRGLYFTSFGITGTALPMVATVIGGLLLTAILAWRGRLHQASLATLSTVLVATAIWFALDLGIERDMPRLGRYNVEGGLTLTPEFMAVLVGSVLYASAFAAEIVRGGIEAVPAGQWAACRAMGLTDRQSLRTVIVPQALRIMVPPMTSQFINILKNSTLALVVGYPELNFIANTSMNHTGQALESVGLLMLVFLVLAATISLLMNRLNRHAARWAQ